MWNIATYINTKKEKQKELVKNPLYIEKLQQENKVYQKHKKRWCNCKNKGKLLEKAASTKFERSF